MRRLKTILLFFVVVQQPSKIGYFRWINHYFLQPLAGRRKEDYIGSTQSLFSSRFMHFKFFCSTVTSIVLSCCCCAATCHHSGALAPSSECLSSNIARAIVLGATVVPWPHRRSCHRRQSCHHALASRATVPGPVRSHPPEPQLCSQATVVPWSHELLCLNRKTLKP